MINCEFRDEKFRSVAAQSENKEKWDKILQTTKKIGGGKDDQKIPKVNYKF